MAKTDATILAQAQTISNETNARANTASRVGATLQDLVTEKINADKINVDPTFAANSDALVPSQKAVNTVITAINTAVAGKQATIAYTTENVANKSTSIITDAASDTKYPSVKAVKTYADAIVVPLIVKVSVLSADILSFFSTPKLLIAAPGAGFFINPISIGFMMKSGTTIYSTQTSVLFSCGSSLGTIASVLDNTVSTTKFFSAAAQNYFVINASNVNSALYMASPTSNPTSGNGTIDVYITYQILAV